MASRLNGETVRWLETLDRDGSFALMSDAQLVTRFLEETSELAFEALVRRHGPMVLSRCRGILPDEHAAADAFQATFVVLARRASNVRDRDRLAPWLARVAKRIALTVPGLRPRVARRSRGEDSVEQRRGSSRLG